MIANRTRGALKTRPDTNMPTPTDMQEEIVSLRKSIDKLTSNVNKKFSNLEKTFGTMLDAKAKEIKDSIDIDVGLLVSRIERVEQKMNEINEWTEPPRVHFDPDVTVVLSNMPQQENEDIEALATEFLAEDLALPELVVVRAMPMRSRMGSPGLVKTELQDGQEVQS